MSSLYELLSRMECLDTQRRLSAVDAADESCVPVSEDDISTKQQQVSQSEMMPAAGPSIFGNGRIPTGILLLKGKIFLFFHLPRELRDQIYDMTLDRKKRIWDSHSHEVHFDRLPYQHLLRLNHQLRHELLERVLQHSTVTIDLSNGAPMRGPLQLRYVSNVQVRIDKGRIDQSSLRTSNAKYNLNRSLEAVQKDIVDEVVPLKTLHYMLVKLFVPRDIRVHTGKKIQVALHGCKGFMRSSVADSGRSKFTVYAYKKSFNLEKPLWKQWNEGSVLCMRFSLEADD